MNQFFLQKGYSVELDQFAHIIEFAIQRNSSIQLGSFDNTSSCCIRIYYILEGKFEWAINGQQHTLYPGDLVLIQPGQKFAGQEGVPDIGTLCWIYIEVEKSVPPEKILLGKWSGLLKNEMLAFSKTVRLSNSPVLSRIKEAGRIFTSIQHELYHQQIGYFTRTNQLIDELLIVIARNLTLQNNTRRDFPQTFMNLEKALRENLSHQWTVEEMAALVGLGTTTFTEKVKTYSGFSPLNYLITIRIAEAIRLLKKSDLSVTDIALETGFYSSQHFSTTFKKLTGNTPSDFRKKNSSNE